MRKHLTLDVPDTYRLIVVSDVHGHHEMLEQLLQRIGRKDSDILILLGDFINKGIDSYRTYQYMCEMAKHPNTYFMKGNHELFIYRHLTDVHLAQWFLGFLKDNHFETLPKAILDHEGIDINTFADGEALVRFFRENYQDMLNFLNDMPIIMEVDKFRLVHGGYERDFKIDQDEVQFLKYDDYNRLGKPQEKMTIVGHWPVKNIRKDQMTNMPFYNKEKKILSIDGGMGVTNTGELNALIIEKNGDDYQYHIEQENHFEKRKILVEKVFDEEEPVYVSYPFFDVEVLEYGPFMSLCRHVNTDKVLSVFTSLLEKKEDGYGIKTNYINRFFNLPVGEEVEVGMIFEECVLVKYKDEFGWILREQIDI